MFRLANPLPSLPRWVRLARAGGEENAADTAPEPVQEDAPENGAPQPATFTPDTPLGRLARRGATMAQQPEPEALSAAEPPADFDADPAPTPAPLSGVVFYARLALAMLFVAALFYKPVLALALLGLVVPLFIVMKLVSLGIALLAKRRAAAAALA